ncbi:MAG: 4Fe-4S binding protein [Desulfobacterota bacterium]|nr:4Fe-4S binding protein [Thermodesulfobacteriota bacterium]
MEARSGPSSYIQMNKALCTGCVLCMNACPTKAIRVRNGKATRVGSRCIDCGECIRACPKGAIKAVTTWSGEAGLSPYSVVGASPVLYAQFGNEVMPNDILIALRKIFNYVYDQAYAHELYNAVTELYIKGKREKEEAIWPLISPACPVVNRLIALRFPSLLQHLLPFIPPREIAAREMRRRFRQKKIFGDHEAAIYHVSPCAAKMISIQAPMFTEKSYLSGALGINEIYDLVTKHLGEEDEDLILHVSSGVGVGWGMSGGEIAGLEDVACLAVSGMQETIRYLEKIEMGLFRNIEYFEFRSCREGCIGGPLTVADKYQAKGILQKFGRMFGHGKRVRRSQVLKAYQDGVFLKETQAISTVKDEKRLSIAEAIARQDRVESILRKLPGKECGQCGSPDCRTFAEDVADGQVKQESCFLLRA